MGALSVIIPTYNRKEILRRTLEAYARQSARQDILEVLVVDDGSKDGTENVVHACMKESPLVIRYLRQENRGLAAARNHGIREAQGSLVLFGDDDIFPGTDLVAQHLDWHRKHPDPSVAVLGQVTWAREVLSTPLMRWIVGADMYFRFERFTCGQEVDFASLYFCNTTLKLDFLRKNGIFDEDFRMYGYEDNELGYRLIQKGMRMLYNPAALGYHFKRLSFTEECRRHQQMRLTREIFERKVGVIASKKEQRQPGRIRLLKYRLKLLLLRVLVPLLFPLKPLLDSQIPLPSIVYYAFRRYYVEYGPRYMQK